eukprot:TRINITY_DN34715_c0_g1_i1.p1 TRINITY_DN34715_c0_g1~~TRINITY_DN34715_c0_g1_i1.p1  ORF type:complete len:380 (-),score=38.80 TRINITY_DN34715_c0_g1_i1:205-1344(-)
MVLLMLQPKPSRFNVYWYPGKPHASSHITVDRYHGGHARQIVQVLKEHAFELKMSLEVTPSVFQCNEKEKLHFCKHFPEASFQHGLLISPLPHNDRFAAVAMNVGGVLALRTKLGKELADCRCSSHEEQTFVSHMSVEKDELKHLKQVFSSSDKGVVKICDHEKNDVYSLYLMSCGIQASLQFNISDESMKPYAQNIGGNTSTHMTLVFMRWSEHLEVQRKQIEDDIRGQTVVTSIEFEFQEFNIFEQSLVATYSADPKDWKEFRNQGQRMVRRAADRVASSGKAEREPTRTNKVGLPEELGRTLELGTLYTMDLRRDFVPHVTLKYSAKAQELEQDLNHLQNMLKKGGKSLAPKCLKLSATDLHIYLGNSCQLPPPDT